MTKIELTIAPNYVPNWGIVDAIRELFQNALDQEVQHSDNEMSWEYNPDTQTLLIANKSSVLGAGSLLLGSTSKASDVSTIGQFGEGYKIATLVLLRNNKTITFHNNGAKEVWKPRFVKSRKFGTDILTFFIEKASVFKRLNNSDLTIEVNGITPEEFENEIKPSNLHILQDFEVLEQNSYGRAIDIPGKVFVNGLFVCEYPPYKYGYDFKPAYIKLDRDRKMVSDFDLRWSASRIWATSSNNLVLDMVEAGDADVAYITSLGGMYHFSDEAYNRFMDVYGPEAVPVVNQEELDAVPDGYKGIIVKELFSELIKSSSYYSLPESFIKSPAERLAELFTRLSTKYGFTEDEVEEFDSILSDL